MGRGRRFNQRFFKGRMYNGEYWGYDQTYGDVQVFFTLGDAAKQQLLNWKQSGTLMINHDRSWDSGLDGTSQSWGSLVSKKPNRPKSHAIHFFLGDALFSFEVMRFNSFTPCTRFYFAMMSRSFGSQVGWSAAPFCNVVITQPCLFTRAYVDREAIRLMAIDSNLPGQIQNPRVTWAKNLFNFVRGWQMSLFGDFEHHLQISVGD